MAFSKPNLDAFKGVALIISNDYAKTGIKKLKLTGTHKDSEKMETVFKQFKYHVIKVRNLSKSDLENYFTTLSELTYPETCRRIVVTFSGHGRNGELLCNDLKEIKIKDLLNQFKPDSKNKPTLGNTVRIFFLDACRGRKKDTGYAARDGDSMEEDNTEEDDTKEDVDKTIPLIPVEGNTFVGYSSTCYHKFFETDSGGLWTSALAETLQSKVDASLNEVFIIANDEMSRRQLRDGKSYFQTAQCVHDLKEEVYFWKECQGTVFIILYCMCSESM